MRVLILGGGWYGNFIGLVFKVLGIELVILELKSDIFCGSSSKNQNRLHQGYHYPRSEQTRDECIRGYNIFMKLFKFMTSDVKNNYYLIEKNGMISYDNYKKIYEEYNDGMGFKCIDKLDIDLDKTNIDGIIKCNERLINHEIAYNFFKKTLNNNTILNYDVSKLRIDKDDIYYDDIKYDYLINCTYGQIFKNDLLEYEYELCVSFIYNSDVDYALTLMDGEFFSIYPYMSNKYTLTDVEFTPMKKSNDIDDIINYQNTLTNEIIIDTKMKIENKVKKYLLNFDELFVYDSYNISYKCKFKNGDGDRSVKYFRDGNVLNFIGGKITGIFGMAQIVCDELLDGTNLDDVYDMIELECQGDYITPK